MGVFIKSANRRAADAAMLMDYLSSGGRVKCPHCLKTNDLEELNIHEEFTGASRYWAKSIDVRSDSIVLVVDENSGDSSGDLEWSGEYQVHCDHCWNVIPIATVTEP